MSSLIFCCQVHTAPPTPKAKKEVEQASTSHFSKISFLDQQDTSSFDIVKATQYGAFDRVQEIIESGFDVNERDEVNKIHKLTNQWAPSSKSLSFSLQENVTLLHWASINNRREIVQYFLQLGADCNAVGGELMSTPLHWATRWCHSFLLLAYKFKIEIIPTAGRAMWGSW